MKDKALLLWLQQHLTHLHWFVLFASAVSILVPHAEFFIAGVGMMVSHRGMKIVRSVDIEKAKTDKEYSRDSGMAFQLADDMLAIMKVTAIYFFVAGSVTVVSILRYNGLYEDGVLSPYLSIDNPAWDSTSTLLVAMATGVLNFRLFVSFFRFQRYAKWLQNRLA